MITTRYEIGDEKLRPWNCLVKAKIQDREIEGSITVHSADQEKAKTLACVTYVNYLRRLGVWSRVEEKEDEKIYHAPTLDNVEFIDFSNMSSHDLTFPSDELETARELNRVLSSATKKKKRTKGEAALAKKKARQQKQEVEVDVFQPILEYFKEPKALKDAAKDLGVAYQVVRYRVQQIGSKGVAGQSYDVIESKVGKSKAVQIKKRDI